MARPCKELSKKHIKHTVTLDPLLSKKLLLLSESTGKNRSEVISDLIHHGYIIERLTAEDIKAIRVCGTVSNNLNQLTKRIHGHGLLDARISNIEVILKNLDLFLDKI